MFSLLGVLGHKDIMPSYRWPGFWNHKTLRAGASHTFHPTLGSLPASARFSPQGTSMAPHRVLSEGPRLVHLGTPPPCGRTEVNPTLNTAGDAWRWLLTLIVIRASGQEFLYEGAEEDGKRSTKPHRNSPGDTAEVRRQGGMVVGGQGL